MFGISKSNLLCKFFVFVTFLLVLLLMTALANASPYIIHGCEACGYQYRIEAEAGRVKCKCPACGYETTLEVEAQPEMQPQVQSSPSEQLQKPLSTKKQINKSLKEAKKQIIEEAIGSLSNAIIGASQSTGEQIQKIAEEQPPPSNSRSYSTGRIKTGNSQGGQGKSMDIECSLCGHSAVFFPYADKTKKKLKCPSCGEIKNL